MSTNCIRCVKNKRTGMDLLCDECRASGSSPAHCSALFDAAAQMDWVQVVLNGGPPCFHLYEDGRFCGRAKRWVGHDDGDPHKFVSLEALLRSIAPNDRI